MNIKDQIYAVINRRYNENLNTTKVLEEKCGESSVAAALFGAAAKEDYEILAFLDSLPEQPVIKKSNALFDKCVENCDPAVMKEVSDNVDKMLGRQPVEGLEEAAHNFALHYDNGTCDGIAQDCFIAGAEWDRAKMLDGAVEGVAEELYNDGEIHCTIGVGACFQPGQEVYVIKKEEDK